MPLSSEEPQISESASTHHSGAGTTRTPQASRPAPLPGPRPAPRPVGRTADIQLVPATGATAVEAADEAVDSLLDGGRAPDQILVLTTGDPHPWAEHEMSFGEDAYWRQLADADDVFCAHVSAIGSTGGRPVVVLAVNGGTDGQIAHALPQALGKAGERLLVCGDPQRLGTLL